MEGSTSTFDPRILQDFLININQINKILTAVRQNNNGPNTEKHIFNPNETNQNCIIITNTDSKYKLRYGEQFKEMLDSRDLVLQHSFNINVGLNLQDIQQKDFLNSETYKNIGIKIRQFLVQTLSNILSVSFKHLNSSQLEVNEVKNYVSSNIVLNIQSIFIKTIQSIEQLNNKNGLKLNLQEIKTSLVGKLQLFAKEILINLIDHYPRGNLLGGTSKIKNLIKEINRVDDDNNDLTITNDIKIGNYIQVGSGQDDQGQQYEKIELSQNPDYSDLIMEAVNASIKVVHKSYNDAKQRPNKQVFQELARELFGLSLDESFRELVQFASPKQRISKQIKNLKEQVCKQFESLSSAPAPLIVVQQNQKTQRSVSIIETQKVSLKDNPEEKSSFTTKESAVINSRLQKILQTLKDYQIGIKIPNHIIPFTKAEIAEKIFVARHPSVSRIVSKWADYLKGIFDDPQHYISLRLYNYKDLFNNPISLEKNIHKIILINNLKREAIEVQQKLNSLKNKTVKLFGEIIFKENQSFAQSVFRFSNTRKISSKINAVISSLTVQYLSILIHHLIKAGQIFQTNEQGKKKHISNVNLIVFNIGDLLRARFKCTQSSFITIIKSLYILDENENLTNKFKLINIKNNFDSPANNTVINFLIMGKTVCQIELSLQQSKTKQKNYFAFSQLVNQLIKNSFGVISSCATLIARFDPTLNSCQHIYYQQKKEQNIYQGQVNQVQNIYYCQNCKQLIINDSTKLFKPDQRRLCLKCKCRQENILQKINKDNLKVQKKLKDQLYQHILNKRLLRVNSYQNVRLDQDHYKIYAKLEPRGKMELFMVINVKSELKHFMVKITPRVLVYSGRKVINFQELVDYINISKYIKEKKQITDHFLFEVIELQTTGFIFGFNALNRQKLARFARQFERFRKEKSIIKSIKYKTEIINCDQDQDKWLRFQQIIQVYAIDDLQERAKQIEQKLRFRRYKHLDFLQIKKLQANQCEIKQLFKDMQLKCVNIKEIIMRKNQLRNIYGLDKITKLHQLDLSGNKLENVDGLGHLQEVFTLNLSYNQILNVIGLKQLKNINTLDLSQNPQLDELDGLENVTIANTMSFYRCFLTNIEGLKHLKAINVLDLRHNRLSNLDGLNSITTINTLYLKGNNLVNFAGLQQATTINALDLRSNKLVTLQKMMSGMQSTSTIHNIDLSRNELKDIFDIQFINTIHALDISHNQIDNIVCLKKFSTITELLVHNNKQLKINCLPHSIQILSANASQLKTFDFKDCPNLRTLRTDSDNRDDFKNLPKHIHIDKLYALF